MSSVRDLRDFPLFFFGLAKFNAFFLMGGGRKKSRTPCNRVLRYVEQMV